MAGERIRCRRLVITTGTFLRGVIHIGSQSRPAGRMPSTAASDAAAAGPGVPAAAAAQATDAADETAALAAGMKLPGHPRMPGAAFTSVFLHLHLQWSLCCIVTVHLTAVLHGPWHPYCTGQWPRGVRCRTAISAWYEALPSVQEPWQRLWMLMGSGSAG